MMQQISAIVAMSENYVIGVDGVLPWHYSGDLRRFKEVTLNSTIIMGRRTWQSIGCRKLPQRRNMVISGQSQAGVETFDSLVVALSCCDGLIWLIGGAALYHSGLPLCQRIDVTFVPGIIEHPSAVYFPELNTHDWQAGTRQPHPYEVDLSYCVYTRITQPTHGRRLV
ncbi:MAG TPA: hypothetical protein ENI62_00960 [Gammaproteobacteria bacterium]|nr:hypothetical protein [Gammaproteobacteria bacterium]